MSEFWTIEETAVLKKLVERGYWINEAALVLKTRSKGSIQRKIANLNLHRNAGEDRVDYKALEMLDV